MRKITVLSMITLDSVMQAPGLPITSELEKSRQVLPELEQKRIYY